MSGGKSGRGISWAPSISLVKALSLTILVSLFVLPLANIIQGSSLGSLAELLTDPYILRVIANTFIQAGLSTIPAVSAAIPLAYFFARYEFRFSTLARAVLLAPFFAPAFAAAQAFLVMYGRRGVVNTILMGFFNLTEPPLSLLYNMEAVVLAHVFYYIPVAFLTIEASLASIDQDLIDAAKCSGASEWRIFRKVMLPQIIPALAASCILVFIYSFLTFATPLLIGGSFTTLEVEIYFYWSKFGGWTTAKTLSVLQLGLNLAFVTVMYLTREHAYQPRMVAKAGRLGRSHLNLVSSSLGVRALTVYTLSLLAFEALPIYFIFASGFTQSFYLVFPVGASLENFSRLFSFDFGTQATVLDSMAQSIAIGTIAALLAIPTSIMTAYSILYSRGRVRSFFSAASTAPIAVSHVAIAAGLYTVYGVGLLRLYGGWEILVIAHLLFIYPLTTRLIESAWLKIDPEIVDAALTAGASRLYTFLRVELRLMAPSIIAASLIAFASSIGEFTYALFFSTGGLQTMPVSVERLLDFRQLGLASAMTSLILTVIFISALAANLLASKGLGEMSYGA